MTDKPNISVYAADGMPTFPKAALMAVNTNGGRDVPQPTGGNPSKPGGGQPTPIVIPMQPTTPKK